MGAAPGALTDPRRPGAELRWSEGLAAAALGWIAARVAVAAGFVAAHLLSGSVDLPDGRLHLDQGLLTWDGTFYRVITEGWYSGAEVPVEAARFFPGYPALARLLSPLALGNEDVALLLISNAAALAAGVFVWRLAAEATGDAGVGVRAAWMVAVIPAANILAFAYTESLMLLIVTLALLALHRARPGWAAVLGLAAGLLRPQGVLLAVPAAVEAWKWWSSAPRRRPGALAARAAAVFAPLVGLAASMWIVSRRTGDVFEAYGIQRELRDGFRDPLTRIGQALWDFTQGHLHDVYNVAFALGFLALFVVAVRRRQPLSWLALMAVTWLVAVGGNNMDSVGRYCLVASPFAIALAQWAESRARQVAVAVVGLGGTVWFTAEVMLGRIVP